MQQCFINNPDGAGFAVLEDDGNLLIEKGFFTFDSFFESYKPHAKKQALIHFRIKTHGQLDEKNCHPFVLNDDISFIHNGVIHCVPNNKDKSDTIMFNEEVLQPLINMYGNDILYQKPFQKLLEETIGSSKLAFLDKKTKEFVIINKNLGNEKQGIWFSNFSWVPPAPKAKKKEHKYNYGHNNWNQKNDDVTVVDYHKKMDGTIINTDDTVTNKCRIQGDQRGIPYSFVPGEIATVDAIYSDGLIDVYFLTAKFLLTDVSVWKFDLVAKTITEEEAKVMDSENKHFKPQTAKILTLPQKEIIIPGKIEEIKSEDELVDSEWENYNG